MTLSFRFSSRSGGRGGRLLYLAPRAAGCRLGGRGALDGSGSGHSPWIRNRTAAHPPVLGLLRGPEESGGFHGGENRRGRRGGRGRAGRVGAQPGRRPRARCARPGVGPACLAPWAPSSSRGTHGPLARLPHSPRRSSASLLPSAFLRLGRERGRRLRAGIAVAGIAVAGARGGGGARAAVCFRRVP